MTTSSPPGAPEHVLWHGADLATTLPEALVPAHAQRLGALVWDSTPEGRETRVALPAVAAGTLIIPSLILGATAPIAYAMRFEWGDDGAIDLAPIVLEDNCAHPWPKAHMDTVTASGARARGGLDCIEALDDIAAPHLIIRCLGTEAPDDAALLLSLRARHASVHDDGGTSAILDVPAFSQMTHAPAIARHVCSPVSVAMVLAAQGRQIDPEAFALRCVHPDYASLFGMWPLNLARAWQTGLGGMVRSFRSPREIAELLDAGIPIVASIRFEQGALPGAPLTRTSGHLVVLRGLTATHAEVNDPAAPSDAEVPRRYDRAAFLDAWLADRGVGYVFWPRARGGSALDNSALGKSKLDNSALGNSTYRDSEVP